MNAFRFYFLVILALLPRGNAIAQDLAEELGVEMGIEWESLVNAADAAVQTGNYKRAISLMNQAIEVGEQSDRPDKDSGLIASFLILAHLHKTVANYEESHRLYKHVIRLLENEKATNNTVMAQALEGLADIYHRHSRYADAEPLYRRALLIAEEVMGRDNLHIGSLLYNLASVQFWQNRYAEAEPLYRQSLSIRERLLGDTHADVRDALYYLAKTYYYQNRIAQVEPLLKRAIEIDNALSTPSSLAALELTRLSRLELLATVYSLQGKSDEAEETRSHVFSLRTKDYISEFWRLADSMQRVIGSKSISKDMGNELYILDFLSQQGINASPGWIDSPTWAFRDDAEPSIQYLATSQDAERTLHWEAIPLDEDRDIVYCLYPLLHNGTLLSWAFIVSHKDNSVTYLNEDSDQIELFKDKLPYVTSDGFIIRPVYSTNQAED